jgi:hypothetical protein
VPNVKNLPFLIEANLDLTKRTSPIASSDIIVQYQTNGTERKLDRREINIMKQMLIMGAGQKNNHSSLRITHFLF